MINIVIPPSRELKLKYLCLDLNGTVAFNKTVINGVGRRLDSLKDTIKAYVVTADTHGNAEVLLKGLPVELVHTSGPSIADSKLAFVRKLGVESTVCVGNGYNDRLMLKEAALSIAVLGGEGVFTGALQASHIAVVHVNDALDLLLNPERIAATLRD